MRTRVSCRLRSVDDTRARRLLSSLAISLLRFRYMARTLVAYPLNPVAVGYNPETGTTASLSLQPGRPAMLQ